MDEAQAYSPSRTRFWTLIVTICGVTALLVGLQYLSHRERLHISSFHDAALIAGETALSDLTMAHLQTEEVMSGDTHFDPQRISQRFHSVETALQMLNKLSKHQDMFRSPSLAELQDLSDGALENLAQMLPIVTLRLQNPAGGGADSELDRRFDTLFTAASNQLNRINVLLKNERDEHILFNARLQLASAMLILLAGLFILLMTLRYDREQRASFRKLLDFKNRLVEREQRLTAIFTGSPDMILVLDSRANILEANAHALEALDLAGDNLPVRGTGLLAADAESQAAIDNHFAGAVAGDEQEFEWHLPARAGEPRQVEMRMHRLHDAGGQEQRVMLIMRDLTEIRQLQQSLLREERRFRTIFEQSPVALWEEDFSAVKRRLDKLRAAGITDLSTRFREDPALLNSYLQRVRIRNVNRAALELHHADNRPQLLAGLQTIFTPRSLDDFADQLTAIHAGNTHIRFATEVKTLDGHLRDVLVHLSIAPHAEADWSRVFMALVDVTQLKHIERDLAEAQRIAHIGSWSLDIPADRLEWSDEIFQIFELDPAQFDVSYEAFLAAVHPDDRNMVNQAYRDSLQSRQPYAIEHRLLMPDGRIKYVLEKCETSYDEAGQPLRSTGTVQDISERVAAETERKDAQLKLEHVQRLESLGLLAGGIAHDFNNLLTAIMGNTGLAKGHIPATNRAQEYVARIEATSKRAAELCQQMLAYSGKGRFVIKPINLSELVGEMTHLLKVSINKEVMLRLQLPEQLPPVDADIAQMQQVIMNLVTNASEAIGEQSGVITVATGVTRVDAGYLASLDINESVAEGRYVYLEVSDTGCGMDEETKRRLFDPFFTTKFTGRGLGMAAVLGIVRGHHGAIKVYTEPGKGSSFKVMFPCSELELPEMAATTATPQPLPQGEGTILVVDDEESIREVTALLLESVGFHALQAADGVEAVELFREHHGDIVLVLLDMTMPRMGGEETFSALRGIDTDVKVVLSSGYNEQDATNRFVGKKLAGFIKKPYMPEELYEKVNSVLARG